MKGMKKGLLTLEEYGPIVKNTIHAGQKYFPLCNGSKAIFHFQTWTLGKERTLIDDSKVMGNKEPMTIIIGLKFKMEIWEVIVKMMAVGEVASFKVAKEVVLCYPLVSKTLRERDKELCKVKHSCAMTLQTEGIGYPDLDDLMNNPRDLEFIIELIKVEHENEYEKEVWQLSEKERLDLIPPLKEKGNALYAKKLYEEAEAQYRKAIGITEQLMLRERKNDEDWVKLNKIKLPILLNYAQCMLIKHDYYSVIEHCSTVLEYDKDNEKALYRRGKAHIGAWNPDHAEADFTRLKTLNPGLTTTVDKELAHIKQLRKEKAGQDKEALKNLF